MEPTDFKAKDLLDATGATTALTDREKHLIGLAVTITRGCQFCTGGRIAKALESGIDYQTIRSTVDLTAAVNAGVALRTAIQGVEMNNLQDACTDDLCTVGTPS